MNEELIRSLKGIQEALANLGTSYESMQATIAAQQEEMDKRFAAMEGRMVDSTGKKRKAVSRGVVSIPGLEDELHKFSWVRAINGIHSGNWDQAGFEDEVFKQAAKRAVNQTTSTQGGFLVPEELQLGIIEALTNRSTVIRAGATWLQGLSGGTLEFNREDSVLELSAQGENLSAAMSDNTPTLDQLTLSQNNAGVMCYISRSVLANASESVDAWVQGQMVKAAARYIDEKALAGSGTSNEPLGVINDTALQQLTLSSAPVEFEDLMEMKTMLSVANAWDPEGEMGIIWNPRVRQALALQRVWHYSSQGQNWSYLFGARLGNLDDKLGFSEYESNVLSGVNNSGEGVLGNWEELLIASWGNFEIQRSDDYRFGHNQVALRLVIGMDVGARHDDSFVRFNDASINPV